MALLTVFSSKEVDVMMEKAKMKAKAKAKAKAKVKEKATGIAMDMVDSDRKDGDSKMMEPKKMPSNALADLGASINFMSYSLFTKLRLGEAKPTRMSIQLAYRTIEHPRGIVGYVLVKIDKFIFPVDFVIMAIIDVYDGQLELRLQEILLVDPLQVALQAEDEHELSNESVLEQLAFLLANVPSKNINKFIEIDKVGVQKLRLSLEEPLVLDLKELSKHLNYAYLDKDNRLPIILVADLTPKDREMTLATLKKCTCDVKLLLNYCCYCNGCLFVAAITVLARVLINFHVGTMAGQQERPQNRGVSQRRSSDEPFDPRAPAPPETSRLVGPPRLV
ncbi:uncharacterized protein LOC125371181 [Ricinus communis]|uniref:uncharacterized protein LOC125371181 n=1 Tax=Ricinus communis TaxID=3988 RepID=UPI00201AF08D|nr:uncharacterized protein LOC125371181 [Ricinus communis]